MTPTDKKNVSKFEDNSKINLNMTLIDSPESAHAVTCGSFLLCAPGSGVVLCAAGGEKKAATVDSSAHDVREHGGHL